MPRVAWTIAGFDPSSGAGITADLATFAAHGVFGCSAITALTVQSTRGVAGVEITRPELLERTLVHLAQDLPPTGVKIGMLGSAQNMVVISRWLRQLGHTSAEGDGAGRAAPVPIVVLDPVLRSSSGRELYPLDQIEALRQELLPLADVITPNRDELALLAERTVSTTEQAVAAAVALMAPYPRLNVVVTGGDQARALDLLVLQSGEVMSFAGEHVETEATHGTGCAFSSALLANLVQGLDLPMAVESAKGYVAEAMRQAPGIGGGKGPMELLWPLRSGGGRSPG